MYVATLFALRYDTKFFDYFFKPCDRYKGSENFCGKWKNEHFYKGIDNPVSFAVEGVYNKSLIVKAKNGIIRNEYGYDTFQPDSIGKAEIIIYKRLQGKLKEIGRSAFRVKAIPDPIAKVWQSAGGRIKTVVLKAQQFIRADIENFDIHVRIPIDSFTICITRTEPCFYKELHNSGGINLMMM